MSAAILEFACAFIVTSALLVLAVLLIVAVHDWRKVRAERRRRAEEEADRARQRAWWAFWAAMHESSGGQPIPFPGDR